MLLYMSLEEALNKNKKNLKILIEIQDLIISFNLENKKDKIDLDNIANKIVDIHNKNKKLREILKKNIFDKKNTEPAQKEGLTGVKEQELINEKIEEGKEKARQRKPLRRMPESLNEEEEEILTGVKEQELLSNEKRDEEKEKARMEKQLNEEEREKKQEEREKKQEEEKATMGKQLNEKEDEKFKRKYLQYKLKYFRLKEKYNL